MNLAYAKNYPHQHQHALVALTGAFLLRLTRALQPPELELSVLKQRTAPDGVSELQTYCDANQVMLDALEDVFVYQFVDEEFDVNDPFISWLIDAAWVRAQETLDEVYRARIAEQPKEAT